MLVGSGRTFSTRSAALRAGPIILFPALSQQRERSLSICLAQVEFPRRNPQPDFGEESDDSAAVRNGVSRCGSSESRVPGEGGDTYQKAVQ